MFLLLFDIELLFILSFGVRLVFCIVFSCFLFVLFVIYKSKKFEGLSVGIMLGILGIIMRINSNVCNRFCKVSKDFLCLVLVVFGSGSSWFMGVFKIGDCFFSFGKGVWLRVDDGELRSVFED